MESLNPRLELMHTPVVRCWAHFQGVIVTWWWIWNECILIDSRTGVYTTRSHPAYHQENAESASVNLEAPGNNGTITKAL